MPASTPVSKAPPLPAPVRAALMEATERLRAAYGDRLRRVVLYGSYARGDARPKGHPSGASDVDLLVVLDGFEENQYQEHKRVGGAWGDLLERHGLFFSFHLYTEEAYQDRRRPFIRNVHRDGIQL